MALFQASGEQLAEYKKKLIDEVAPHVGGEGLVAVGMFRRGGFGASYAASKMGGGLLYAGVNLARKKRAGGLPDKLMLAVTPATLYAFSWKYKGRNYRVKEEVARWDRSNLQCSCGQGGNMTTLTIESPPEGEKATLVGAGIQDDPWSQEVIGTLTSEAGAWIAIHKGRSGAGTYWYYWLVIVGGTIFVVAALATDMFGRKP